MAYWTFFSTSKRFTLITAFITKYPKILTSQAFYLNYIIIYNNKNARLITKSITIICDIT